MFNKKSMELFFIVTLFFVPFFLATTLYINVSQDPASFATKTYGYAFQPGENLDRSFDSRWTILHCSNPSSDRYSIWEQQLPVIKKMLGPLGDHVNIEENTDPLVQSALSLPYPIDNGAILLVDNRGFLALGYHYDQEPKKIFLEIKKLVKLTS